MDVEKPEHIQAAEQDAAEPVRIIALHPFKQRLPEGESVMAQRMRAFDWSPTQLGNLELWPEQLRTALDICLGARVPMQIWWGPELHCLYNDAFCEFLQTLPLESPWLGRPCREAWGNAWEKIAPLVESVRLTGLPKWSD